MFFLCACVSPLKCISLLAHIFAICHALCKNVIKINKFKKTRPLNFAGGFFVVSQAISVFNVWQRARILAARVVGEVFPSARAAQRNKYVINTSGLRD